MTILISILLIIFGFIIPFADKILQKLIPDDKDLISEVINVLHKNRR